MNSDSNNDSDNDNDNDYNNKSKTEILSNLTSKKRGNEVIDMQLILSLDNNKKKKRIEPQLPVKWDEIDIDRLGGNNLNEIIEISKSIGISIVGARNKLELINKIKTMINRNKSTIENNNKRINNNPFNKTTFEALVFTQDEQGKNELLFWKVFKNKSIYKNIMSNMYSDGIPYEYIISIETMLDNGLIGVLKDKVNRNQYITFSISSNYQMDLLFIRLFSTIKEDQLFYRSLFINYRSQISYISNGTTGELFNLSKLLIKSNCIAGLQVLFNDFQFKPTNECLIHSFIYDDMDTIKFLFDSIPLDEIIFNLLAFKFKTKVPQTIEIISFIMDKLNPTKQEIKSQNQFFKNLFKFNILHHPLKDLLQIIDLFNLFDSWELIQNSNFKYPIIWLPNEQQLKEEQRKQQPQEERNNNIASIPSIEEIKSIKFSNKQLESNLNESINYSSNEKESIKKFIDIFYKMGDQENYLKEWFVEYYICYGSEYAGNGFNHLEFIGKNKTTKTIGGGNIILFKLGLEYAHYPTIKNWLMYCSSYGNELNTPYESIIGIMDNRNLTDQPDHEYLNILFKYCNNHDQQVSFLDLLIRDIMSNDQSFFKIPIRFLFLSLVNNDNLQLLGHLVRELGKEIIISRFHSFDLVPYAVLKSSITRYIKSIEMVDYILNEFYQIIIEENVNRRFITCHIKNLNLLKHFQSLVIQKQQSLGIDDQKKISVGNKFSIISKVERIPVDMVHHILNNPKVYDDFKFTIETRPSDFDENDTNKQIYFSSLKSFIDSTTIADLNFKFSLFHGQLESFISYYPPKYIVHFFKWLWDNKSKDNQDWFIQGLKNIGLNINSFKYIIGYNDELFNGITTNGIVYKLNEIVKFSIERGDLFILEKVLNILLEHFKQLKSIHSPPIENIQYTLFIQSFILNYILKRTISLQQVLVLEYLYLNFNQIFKINTEKSDGLLTLIDLRSLVYHSLSFDNIIVSEFLLTLYPITKIQFEIHTKKSPLSFNHFKNKFK